MSRADVAWLCLSLALVLAPGGCGRDEPGATMPAFPPDAARGAELFATVCAQCHGPDALGITGRGKNLKTSPFVAASSDAELVAMIRGGRPATTEHPAMPPKGGRLDLTTQDLFDIVAHVRSLRADP
jgi:mono/diheme cytochrome c family protein